MSVWNGKRLYAVTVDRVRKERFTVYAIGLSATDAQETVKALDSVDLGDPADVPESEYVEVGSARLVERLADIPEALYEDGVFGDETSLTVGTALEELLFDSMPKGTREPLRRLAESCYDARLPVGAFAGLNVADSMDWWIVGVADEDFPSSAIADVADEMEWDDDECLDAEGQWTEAGLAAVRVRVNAALARARAFLSKYAAQHPDGGAFALASAVKPDV